MIFECTPALADALTTLLRHEGISYGHGLGPGCIAIVVKKKDERKMLEALSQWHNAITALTAQAELMRTK